MQRLEQFLYNRFYILISKFTEYQARKRKKYKLGQTSIVIARYRVADEND